jgi:hypothetical protein
MNPRIFQIGSRVTPMIPRCPTALPASKNPGLHKATG